MSEPSLSAVFEHSRLRDARKGRALVALIVLLAALLVTDHIWSGITESSQAGTITAQANTIQSIIGKSKEQTKAETQLRGIVTGQQVTISALSQSLHKAHPATVAALDQILAFDNALGFVVIDAFH